MTTSADQGSIAEVGSPVLIAPAAIDDRRPWRWTATALATATAVLLLFNAEAMRGWFDDLTPNTLTERLRGPIATWADATKRAGLDGPRSTLHATWERVRKARFAGEHPGERGAE